MAAIADLIGSILALIFEMLVWSLVGFWKVCRAVFSKTGRRELSEKWKKSLKDRLVIVGEVVLWVPVFVVGFGFGLPLAYRSLTVAFQEERKPSVPLEGKAEIKISHPKDPEKELVVRIDRSRISEIKDTKDIADLMKKLREISDIEEKTKPNQAPQPNAGGRPSSDDSSASETPSSPGPRG